MKQLHKKGTVVISRVSERWTAGWRSLYASKKASNQPNRLRILAVFFDFRANLICDPRLRQTACFSLIRF